MKEKAQLKERGQIHTQTRTNYSFTLSICQNLSSFELRNFGDGSCPLLWELSLFGEAEFFFANVCGAYVKSVWGHFAKMCVVFPWR